MGEHGVKVGQGSQDLEPRDPGPGTPLKFKSETRDPPEV